MKMQLSIKADYIILLSIKQDKKIKKQKIGLTSHISMSIRILSHEMEGENGLVGATRYT